MKKIVVLLILIQCISCKNDTTKVQSPEERAVFVKDSTRNAQIAADEKAKKRNAFVADSTQKANLQAHLNDSIAKAKAKKILKSMTDTMRPNDWSWMNQHFYKHFVGKFGEDSASLNMTFGRGSRYDDEYIYVTIHTQKQMYRFYAYKGEQYEGETEHYKKHLVLFPNIYTEDNSDRHHNYGLLPLAVRLEDADFQGVTIDYKTKQVIPLNFKIAKDDGAIDLTYVNHFQEQEVGITKIVYSLGNVVPDATHQPLMQLFKKEHINQSWTQYQADFAKIRNERLREIKKSLAQHDTSGRDRFISQAVDHIVLYNQLNNIVIGHFKYSNTDEGYGDAGCDFVQINVEKNKILSKSDVLMDDWKQKISRFFEATGESAEIANIMAQRVEYGFFTNAGVVFINYGNHGWYYPQYFVPFSALKAVLKPNFIANYVKN
jgi:hypothetical protein